MKEGIVRQWQSYWRYKKDLEKNQGNVYHLPQLYERTSQVKHKQSWHLSPKFFKAVALLVVSASIIWFLFFGQFFTIKKIDLVGSVTSSVQQDINQLYGKNLLTFSSKNIKTTLHQKQSSIKDLAIYKGLPDTLRIEIALRQSELVWQSGDNRYLIDNEGVAFQLDEEEFNRVEDDLVWITDPFSQEIFIGQKVVNKTFISFAKDLWQLFTQKSLLTAKQLNLGQTSLNLEIVTENNWRIYFDTSRQLEPQLAALVKTISQYHDQIKEYVDLRIADKVFFK